MSIFSIAIKGSEKSVDLQYLSVLRQAFVIAGFMIWLGVGLSLFVNTYFIILPIVVGAGLVFSGLSGFCPMVAILNIAPWNKKS